MSDTQPCPFTSHASTRAPLDDDIDERSPLLLERQANAAATVDAHVPSGGTTPVDGGAALANPELTPTISASTLASGASGAAAASTQRRRQATAEALLKGTMDLSTSLRELQAALDHDKDAARELAKAVGLTATELRRLRRATDAFVDATILDTERTLRRLINYQSALASEKITADDVIRALHKLAAAEPAALAGFRALQEQIKALQERCDATQDAAAEAQQQAEHRKPRTHPKQEAGVVLTGTAAGGAAVGTWVGVEGGTLAVAGVTFVGLGLMFPVALGAGAVGLLGYALYRLVVYLRGRSAAGRSAALQRAFAQIEAQREALAALADDAGRADFTATQINRALTDARDGCETVPTLTAAELADAVRDLAGTVGRLKQARADAMVASATPRSRHSTTSGGAPWRRGAGTSVDCSESSSASDVGRSGHFAVLPPDVFEDHHVAPRTPQTRSTPSSPRVGSYANEYRYY